MAKGNGPKRRHPWQTATVQEFNEDVKTYTH